MCISNFLNMLLAFRVRGNPATPLLAPANGHHVTGQDNDRVNPINMQELRAKHSYEALSVAVYGYGLVCFC